MASKNPKPTPKPISESTNVAVKETDTIPTKLDYTLFQRAAKAVYAFVFGALSTLAVILVGDSSFGDITAGQWVAIAIAALGAGGGVYGIRNLPPKESSG